MVLVSMGTTASTVRRVVDKAREEGVSLGALRVRMFRPFPEAEIARALAGRKVGVLDRDVCPGFGGILWGEVRGAAREAKLVQSYMLGMGGGDIRESHIAGLVRDLASRDVAGAPELVSVEGG
jgi:pyruvate/2-oxoacid:ferredoxin oxidoreductase alpha subunit